MAINFINLKQLLLLPENYTVINPFAARLTSAFRGTVVRLLALSTNGLTILYDHRLHYFHSNEYAAPSGCGATGGDE